ncbi:molybdate transport system ATP-binding protein [Jannaschia faecimaris]|uniref:Molybdate transport system ATP-binding protein n=1 Tax=Jannaschia faecimaris TaxID=1244108 RepID=A0A1H3NMH4_9RHOB|nr:molybdenum ABC transporter ATP-binding protein [Jannaschia faecimaris]SDY89953.1 molybdate transport system ATP-binding protein [Jannaschia faecimaris]
MLELSIMRTVGTFTLDMALKASPGVTAVFGPSGAGKTSLARCVAGLARPDSGRIALDGRVLFDAHTDVAAHRRGIGYVFQEARLFPHMSVRQNLLYGAARGTDPGRVAEMLGIVPLLKRRPAGLSGGEAARVAIGRALLRQPRLLILDEPLAALDARRREAVLPWLEGLRDAGVPILYISHAIEEVARLADMLVLIEGGRVVRSGPLAEVLSDPAAAALMGPSQAGAVLDGLVTGHADGLATVETPVGALQVAGVGPHARAVRVRIRAEDVMIATEPPTGLSALNILPMMIAKVQAGQGPGVMLRLTSGDGALLARITQRSLKRLHLKPGQRVWAVIKTSGVARADVGLTGSR